MSDLLEVDVAVDADGWTSIEDLGGLIERACDGVVASEAMENEQMLTVVLLH